MTTIVDEEDRTVHSSTGILGPEQFGVNRSVDHRFDLPLDRLSPGAYLLRFTVGADRHTAARDVRFVVR
jgi:hypothetical protein